VAVGIKADAEHHCPGHFLFGRVRHQSSLKPVSNPVKPQRYNLKFKLPNELLSTYVNIL
jgi:hypothetical protein